MNSITTLSDNKENIRVIVRIRPRIEREYDQGTYIKVDGNSIITHNKNEAKQYTYDYVATEESSQAEMFDSCARNICDSTLQGYNGTIFVYGQTGAGKTHTLLGPKFSGGSNSSEDNSSQNNNNNNNNNNNTNGITSNNKSFGKFLVKKDEENKGVLPRVIEYLFEKSKSFDSSSISFSCSFLEIYQEQISDLLDNHSNKPIFIRDLSDSVIVEGLSKIPVTSADEALNLVQKGIKLRHVASTNMNNESSRSHAVFSIHIENKQKTIGGKFKIKKSVFNLIDLAGSERQKLTESFGERLKEAGKINKSLMQLGHVIKSLLEVAEGKKSHIHYRDSKLTHLLKDSLGGNSKTCIIANISPANCNMHETISTLVFAQSAKLIKNKAVVNEEINNDNAYKDEIKKLRDKYNFIKSENLYLMSLIEKNKTDSKSSYKGADFSKTLDFVEEEMEIIVNEMVSKEEQVKILLNDNEYLKEKVQSTEIELRLKEKEMRELKEMAKTISQEHDLIKTQLHEYVLKDAKMSQRILNLETMLQNKEFMLNNEIDSLKSSIQESKRMIEFKESVILNLNGEIRNYMMLINQRDVKINELKIEMDTKQQENEDLRNEVTNRQNKEDNLNNQIEFHKYKSETREAEIKLQEGKYDEFRKKGKTLVDQYDLKLENVKLKNRELEEEMRKNKMENRNLNILITDLKKERDAADEKYFKSLDDIKRITLDKETLKEEYFRQSEEYRSLRLDMIKLNEENELLSDNRNPNNNKVSLLNKLKQENSKLKEEVNDLRKNFEYLEKTFNLKSNMAKAKLNPMEFASMMSNREQDLNECRRILHTSVSRIKFMFENNPDDFSFTLTESMRNYMDGKTLEDKFQYYLEKLIKYLEYKEKKENNLRNELEAKESKILTLNREIFLRNTTEDEDVEKENIANGIYKTAKKRHTIGSNVINSVLNSEISKSLFKTNYKRKYGEMNAPLSVINFSNKLNTGLTNNENDTTPLQNTTINGSQQVEYQKYDQY